jgi:hypothetical protein
MEGGPTSHNTQRDAMPGESVKVGGSPKMTPAMSSGAFGLAAKHHPAQHPVCGALPDMASAENCSAAAIQPASCGLKQERRNE